MKEHPRMGLKIIKGIDLFKSAIPCIFSHHESYDGSGYPKGLKGEEIPLSGRLLAVVDTFDAIISDRPYRKGIHVKDALLEIDAHRGTQFDPEIALKFYETLYTGKIDLKELYEIDENMQALAGEFLRRSEVFN